jgi:hypothetical protein
VPRPGEGYANPDNSEGVDSAKATLRGVHIASQGSDFGFDLVKFVWGSHDVSLAVSETFVGVKGGRVGALLVFE